MAAKDGNVSMEGKHEMSPEASPCNANIADDANQPSTGDQNPEGMSPDLFHLSKESLVILNMSELIRVLVIALEIPIGRRGNDQVHGLIVQERQVPCIGVD